MSATNIIFNGFFCRIDKNKVEVEIHGNGGSTNAGGSSQTVLSNSQSGLGMGFAFPNGEYDYTTALTVTITVGACLILLNLVVFAAIVCHRKKSVLVSNAESENGSRRSSHSQGSSTPLKGPYQVSKQCFIPWG